MVCQYNKIDTVMEIQLFQSIHQHANEIIRFHKSGVNFFRFGSETMTGSVNEIHVKSDEWGSKASIFIMSQSVAIYRKVFVNFVSIIFKTKLKL